MPETSLEEQYKAKLYALYPNAQPGAIDQLIRLFKNTSGSNQIKMIGAQAKRASDWFPPAPPPPAGFGVSKRTRNKIRHKRKTHRKSSKKK